MSVSTRPRGRCSVCFFSFTLNSDGTIRGHPDYFLGVQPGPRPWCAGSHRPPAPEPEAE